jgi:iron-sulfur cluster assembly protein
MENQETVEVVETIELSETCAEQVKKQLEKRGTPNAHLRVGLKSGGCSGFSYIIGYEDSAPKEKDKVFTSHGITIVVNVKSFKFLNGCVIDWEQSLLKQGFKFNNPNVKSSCGCGHSIEV